MTSPDLAELNANQRLTPVEVALNDEIHKLQGEVFRLERRLREQEGILGRLLANGLDSILATIKEIGDPALQHGRLISTGSNESVGGHWSTGTGSTTIAITTNAAWVYPFTIFSQVTAYSLFWFNGTAVAGNVDIGIYDEDLNKVITTGSTAQSGVTAPQIVSITPTELTPGRYFLAISSNDAGADFTGVTTLPNDELATLGAFTQGSAFALPASLTPSTTTLNTIVACGFSIVNSTALPAG